MINSVNKYKSIIECNRMPTQLKYITLDQQEMVGNYRNMFQSSDKFGISDIYILTRLTKFKRMHYFS